MHNGQCLGQVLGSTEVRSTVAVKEVPKTGAASEKQAMRELLLLKKKLREVHPNIVQVLDVRSSSSMFYVIMQVSLHAWPGRAASATCMLRNSYVAWLAFQFPPNVSNAFCHSFAAFHWTGSPLNFKISSTAVLTATLRRAGAVLGVVSPSLNGSEIAPAAPTSQGRLC